MNLRFEWNLLKFLRMENTLHELASIRMMGVDFVPEESQNPIHLRLFLKVSLYLWCVIQKYNHLVYFYRELKYYHPRWLNH